MMIHHDAFFKNFANFDENLPYTKSIFHIKCLIQLTSDKVFQRRRC